MSATPRASRPDPAATRAVRTTQPEPVAAAALALRTDPSPAARRRAADACSARGGAGDPDAVRALIEACAVERDPVVRRWAALGLGEAADPDVAPVLARLAREEPDPAVRAILAEAADRLGRAGPR